MTSMLLNEEFVAVFPSLVRRLGGMNKAAVLQAIHFASQVQGQLIGDERWTPMTATQLSHKTGLSDDACQRALSALVSMGVLKCRGAQQGSRKLMWLIQHDQLEASRENAESDSAKTRLKPRDIAECTTTKNNEEEPNNLVLDAESTAQVVVKAFVDKFKSLYNVTPESQSVKRLARDAKRMLDEGRPIKVLIASAEHCALKGHANLSASVTYLLTTSAYEPRGFNGIRKFLEIDPDEQN